jgi:predicted MFS family arabinose efflux permease
VGLVLGGRIVQAVSWRWVFFLNVPIGAAVLALALRVVPESRSESAPKHGYDVAGSITITLATIALVFTLINGEAWGWGSETTIAGFALAAVLIAAFLAFERLNPDPLVPLKLFLNRSLAASDVTFLLVAAALFGMFYFSTLYLQQVLGFDALTTGVAFLPISLTSIAASMAASRILDRFPAKTVLVTGLLITTAGFIQLTQISGHEDYLTHVLPSMVIVAGGLGMSFVPALPQVC